MTDNLIVLGIESSCDETSAAVIQDNKVLSNIIANQTVHQNYGGVVPELASRAHQKNIVPVVQQAIDKANIVKKRYRCNCLHQRTGFTGLTIGWWIFC